MEMTNFTAKETVLRTLETIGYEKTFHVTFMKSDGTWRTIRCAMPTPTKPQFNIPKSIPVMDMDLGEWRSFSVDRVHTITSDRGPVEI